MARRFMRAAEAAGRVRMRALVVMIVVLGAWYGLCLGSYAIFLRGHPGKWEQVGASVVKVPALLLGTLVLVFAGAFLGDVALRTRIGAGRLWGLWVASMAGMALVLAVLSPVAIVLGIIGNYPVCVLGNYVLFSLAGLAGAALLWAGLRAESRRGGHYAPGRWRFVLLGLVWVVLFAVVGAWVGWELRPYIGYAGQPFTWFRSEHATMFEQMGAEWHNLRGR